MPRVGDPGTIKAESNLARRVRVEREQRQWSYEQMARELTSVGCPMHGSTVYKLERQQPRRRISANELAAYAAVLCISETDLLRSPESAEDDRLTTLLRQASDYRREAETAMRQWLAIRRAVGAHLARSDREVRERLEAAALAAGTPALVDELWISAEHNLGTGEQWTAADAAADPDGSRQLSTSDAETVERWLRDSS